MCVCARANSPASERKGAREIDRKRKGEKEKDFFFIIKKWERKIVG